MTQPIPDDRCLDLLYCLAALEAEGDSTGVMLPMYRDHLDMLDSFREQTGPGWTHAVLSGGDQDDRLKNGSLVSWLLNPSGQLRAVDGDQARNLFGNGDFQIFQTVVWDREHEAKFQKMKESHGSLFAYHGSRASNWASILRVGLKNLSHTDRMAHAAVHGDGIYLTPDPRISAQYSHIRLGMTASRDASNIKLPARKNLRALALCEVVEAPGVSRVTSALGSMMVVQENNMVAVRFLIVFPNGQAASIPNASDLATPLNQMTALWTTPTVSIPAGVRIFPVVSVTVPAVIPRGPEARHSVFIVQAVCDPRAQGEVVDTYQSNIGMRRRYSDFRALFDRIGVDTRNAFPPKHAIRSFLFGLDDQRLGERRRDLESWLKEVVGAARHGLLRSELLPELLCFLGVWGSGLK